MFEIGVVRANEYIIAPGLEAYQGYLFDFLLYEGMLCVLIRISSSRRFYMMSVYNIYMYQFQYKNRKSL